MYVKRREEGRRHKGQLVWRSFESLSWSLRVEKAGNLVYERERIGTFPLVLVWRRGDYGHANRMRVIALNDVCCEAADEVYQYVASAIYTSTTTTRLNETGISRQTTSSLSYERLQYLRARPRILSSEAACSAHQHPQPMTIDTLLLDLGLSNYLCSVPGYPV